MPKNIFDASENATFVAYTSPVQVPVSTRIYIVLNEMAKARKEGIAEIIRKIVSNDPIFKETEQKVFKDNVSWYKHETDATVTERDNTDAVNALLSQYGITAKKRDRKSGPVIVTKPEAK